MPKDPGGILSTSASSNKHTDLTIDGRMSRDSESAPTSLTPVRKKHGEC